MKKIIVIMLLLCGQSALGMRGWFNQKLNKELLDAADGGNIEQVKALLDRGASVNARYDQTQATALEATCYRGHFEVAKLLLDRGADVNAVDLEDGTALRAASERGHVEVVRLLLDHGANMNIKAGFMQTTALIEAADNGHREVVKLLVDRGANVNEVDLFGRTALINAAQGGHLGVVLELLTFIPLAEHKAIRDKYFTGMMAIGRQLGDANLPAIKAKIRQQVINNLVPEQMPRVLKRAHLFVAERANVTARRVVEGDNPVLAANLQAITALVNFYSPKSLATLRQQVEANIRSILLTLPEPAVQPQSWTQWLWAKASNWKRWLFGGAAVVGTYMVLKRMQEHYRD